MVDASTLGMVMALYGAGENGDKPTPLVTDKTLTLENRAADAKATGDAIEKVANDVGALKEDIEKLVTVGKNILDYTTLISGYPRIDGEFRDSSSYKRTDFMLVKNGQSIAVSPKVRFVQFYNSKNTSDVVAGKYVETTTANYAFTADSDVYVVIAFYNADVENAQIEYGTEVTSFEPYRKVLSDDVELSNATKQKIASNIDNEIKHTPYGFGLLNEAPSYHAEEIETQVNTILQKTVKPCVIHNVCTDIHFYYDGDSAVMSGFKTINEVANRVSVHANVSLGDYNLGNDVSITQDDSDRTINYIHAMLRQSTDHVYMVNGNHDGVGGDKPNSNNNYNCIASVDDYKVVRNVGKTYFYVDYPMAKTRCLFLDSVENVGGSNVWGMQKVQLQWFVASINSAPNDYSFIVYSHVGIFSENAGRNKDAIKTVINTLNSHSSATITAQDVSPFDIDFAAKTGHVVMWMCGHEHFDWIVPTSISGITSPCVVTTRLGSGNSNPTDASWNVTKPTKTLGTSTECAWDTVVYRPDEHKIYLIRYGAGQDREIDLTNYFTF